MIEPTLLRCNPELMPDHPDVPNPVRTAFGTLYRFQRPGVEILEHDHDYLTVHYSLVLCGAFEIERAGVATVVARPGDMLDFQPGQRHTIRCVEPGILWNGLKRL